MTLRLVFMGTPDFATPTLAALIGAGHDIACVYTQPPRPKGRGLAEELSPVQKLAIASHIPVRMPVTLKDPAQHEIFGAQACDAAVVVAYGLILPKAILDVPRLGCFNVHASLLPRWRGGAHPARHHGGRCGNRRDGDAHGGGARHRAHPDGGTCDDRAQDLWAIARRAGAIGREPNDARAGRARTRQRRGAPATA